MVCRPMGPLRPGLVVIKVLAKSDREVLRPKSFITLVKEAEYDAEGRMFLRGDPLRDSGYTV